MRTLIRAIVDGPRRKITDACALMLSAAASLQAITLVALGLDTLLRSPERPEVIWAIVLVAAGLITVLPAGLWLYSIRVRRRLRRFLTWTMAVATVLPGFILLLLEV